MSSDFQGWSVVGQKIAGLIAKAEAELADGTRGTKLDKGQIQSLRAVAKRLLVVNGVIIADEVGMGKTRIAAAVGQAVIEAGGRVAFLLPRGLGAQWKEDMRAVGLNDVRDVVYSLTKYLDDWGDGSEPLFNQKAVMISHAFTNWRFGTDASRSRWALLPLAWLAWRSDPTLDPRGMVGFRNSFLDDNLDKVAIAIANATKRKIGHAAHARLRQAVFKDLDPRASRNAASYLKEGPCRPRLEQLIGVGFGAFDLIVIDEAHKSRGEDSNLSLLLDSIVIPSQDCRRLAMTATPVELNIGQWSGILERIGVPQVTRDAIYGDCKEYELALKAVQATWRSSEKSRELFRSAAERFKRALEPYVLRRNKREDEVIASFLTIEGESIGSYRRRTPILVLPEQISSQWLDAVFAAEALSAIDASTASSSGQDKRLRLTIANGHGIAALMDAPLTCEEGDADEDGRVIPPGQNARADYWHGVLRATNPEIAERGSARGKNPVLFTHPSIRATVAVVEDLMALDRKVLIFGRYTLPMRALEQIVNARAMLRHLRDDKHWPRSTIEADDDPAVEAALEQMDMKQLYGWSCDSVKNLLEQRNVSYTARRETQLERVRKMLERENFRLEPVPLTTFAGAVLDYLGTSELEISYDEVATAARRIAASLADDDPVTEADETNADDPRNNKERSRDVLYRLAERLDEEFKGPRGGIARLMNGTTKPHTRRNLQLKFNREGCFPYALIAQSRVAREGLNLQEQCRDIILLHPEWNPGVVEQQIGRVDRLNSRWAKDFKAWKQNGENGEIPRIEIRPVMFKGTYDEHNWNTVNERNDLLRGQMHGIIISHGEIGGEEEDKKLAAELNALAPNLSP